LLNASYLAQIVQLLLGVFILHFLFFLDEELHGKSTVFVLSLIKVEPVEFSENVATFATLDGLELKLDVLVASLARKGACDISADVLRLYDALLAADLQ